MHLHQQRGALVDGVFVVVQMGAVGGAYLHQTRTGAFHHVGHAEGTADFDQFAPRDDHFAPARQRCQREQHGRGIVVDHGSRFSTRQRAQQLLNDGVAIAARTAVQVVFQVVRAGHHGQHVLQRGLGQQAAAQVGVDHRAGQVQHRSHAGLQALLQTLLQRVGQAGHGHVRHRHRALDHGRPQGIEQGTRLTGHQRMAMLIQQGLHHRLAQQAVYGGKITGLGHLPGPGTVYHGFVGPLHHCISGSGAGSSDSPNSSSMFTPWRCRPVSATSRSSVSVARSSATGSTMGSRSPCTILR